MLFVFALTFILLACCWAISDATLRTKLVMTFLYGASWLLLLANAAFVIVAQCLLAIVLGGLTFGTEWLTRRH
jgi:hypothetical protein